MEIYNSGKNGNSVKRIGHFRDDSSLGRDSHVPQVGLDRHPATVGIPNKTAIKLATWNVRTLFQCGKLENLKQEMNRLQLNILGICETRWTDAGSFRSDKFTSIYSGGMKHEKGVGILIDKNVSKSVLGYWAISDRILLVKLKGHPFNISIIQVYAPTAECDEEEINQVYTMLEMAKEHCKSQEVVIIMGDLNAKVGEGKHSDVVGMHGLGERNERGQKWIDWCAANSQIITNTWFKQHPRRKWTWKSPGGHFRNQIDYIPIGKRFRNAVKYSKTYPGADCGSDHNPVVCKLAIRLRKLKSTYKSPQLHYSCLQTDQYMRNQYNIAVKNRFEVLRNDKSKSVWDCFKESVVPTAIEIIPKKTKQDNKKQTIVNKNKVKSVTLLHIFYPYGSECWTISKTMEKRLQSAEMWFYRRMLRVSWTNHKSNSEVLSMAGTERKLIQAMRRRQLQFLGHVLRKQELEDVALTGKIEGKRARGKQRLAYISSLSQWVGKSERDILRSAKDREVWKSMATNVLIEYGT